MRITSKFQVDRWAVSTLRHTDPFLKITFSDPEALETLRFVEIGIHHLLIHLRPEVMIPSDKSNDIPVKGRREML